MRLGVMCDVAPVSTIQVTSAPSDCASEATKHASVALPADSLAGVYAVAVRAPCPRTRSRSSAICFLKQASVKWLPLQ